MRSVHLGLECMCPPALLLSITRSSAGDITLLGPASRRTWSPPSEAPPLDLSIATTLSPLLCIISYPACICERIWRLRSALDTERPRLNTKLVSFKPFRLKNAESALFLSSTRSDFHKLSTISISQTAKYSSLSGTHC